MLWFAEDGKVLTWGHGGHGQLGHGDLVNTKTPKVVEALEGQRAVSVACGGAWTTAVTGIAASFPKSLSRFKKKLLNP